MNTLRTFWNQLSPRDQRVLMFGSVALFLIAGWLLVWEPMREARDSWRLRLSAAEADHAFMRAIAPQLQTLAAQRGQTAMAPDGRSLLARVDATARQSGVGEALLRVEPVSATQVRVSFQGASFDALVQWLEQLASGQGVQPGDFSAHRVAGVGRVDARITLEQNEGVP